ncbi:phage tail tape measure protein [Hyphomicrobium sp.]|uniref:phage tail tape measure protein n=1 Tax=Hyphomicrobium sp. TaxID=82 RepID=UPI002E30470B|nr:phage tail tape measure protein [Hyphomicrobium sp.]HEX2843312.1 phage tail tape measure protein [Hyphomicrobium sp.]
MDYNTPVETWTVAIDADTSALANELRQAARLGRQFSNALVGAFDSIAIKGKNVGDVLRNLALRLSEIVLKAAMKPLEQGFGNLLGGLLSGGMAFAKGGVIQQGLPVPFASGGVIQSPIAFPLAGGRLGIAGERGAEAIMPLSRGPDGRLGVAARGGAGVSVTFNVTAQDAQSFVRSEAQIAAMLARAVSLGQRNL